MLLSGYFIYWKFHSQALQYRGRQESLAVDLWRGLLATPGKALTVKHLDKELWAALVELRRHAKNWLNRRRAKGKEPPEGVNQFFLMTWCFSTSTQCSWQRNNRNSPQGMKRSDGQHQND